MMSKSRTKLSDQIRRAIEQCGASRYAIWKATGIDQASLCRFVAGKGGLSIDSLDLLADFLGLDIAVSGKRRTSKKG